MPLTGAAVRMPESGWGLLGRASLSILMQKVARELSCVLLLQGLLLAAHKALLDAKNHFSQLSSPCYIFSTRA